MTAAPVRETPLTVAEAAAYLRKSTSWVYKATRAGGLPVHRAGAELRFFASELEAYIRGEWKPQARKVLPLRSVGGGGKGNP